MRIAQLLGSRLPTLHKVCHHTDHSALTSIDCTSWLHLTRLRCPRGLLQPKEGPRLMQSWAWANLRQATSMPARMYSDIFCSTYTELNHHMDHNVNSHMKRKTKEQVLRQKLDWIFWLLFANLMLLRNYPAMLLRDMIFPERTTSVQAAAQLSMQQQCKEVPQTNQTSAPCDGRDRTVMHRTSLVANYSSNYSQLDSDSAIPACKS